MYTGLKLIQTRRGERIDVGYVQLCLPISRQDRVKILSPIQSATYKHLSDLQLNGVHNLVLVMAPSRTGNNSRAGFGTFNDYVAVASKANLSEWHFSVCFDMQTLRNG